MEISIGWRDIYKVIEAIVPLYVALGLGYGSIKWWRIFTPEQSTAINRLVAYFTFPFFTFDFMMNTNPYTMNYRVIAADGISKVVIVLVLGAWIKLHSKGSYCWSITSFSLSTLTNSLVVGVPVVRAMYGEWAQELVVQLSVVQAIVWLPLLLFVLEVRKAGSGLYPSSNMTPESDPVKDLEGKTIMVTDLVQNRPSLWSLMKIVWLKLAVNPNFYASIVGVAWALVAYRFHFPMPGIMEGSITIMSKAGTGMAMFSMGLFMAQQEKIISCGPCLAMYSMVLRFIAGPAAMTIGSIAVCLRGDVLRVAIIQAAVPQSITSFIFAMEYGLHPEVLSTAVIFGMLVSLPLLIGYYVLLGFVR